MTRAVWTLYWRYWIKQLAVGTLHDQKHVMLSMATIFSLLRTPKSASSSQNSFSLSFLSNMDSVPRGMKHFHSLKKIRTRIPMTVRMTDEQINGEIELLLLFLLLTKIFLVKNATYHH